MYIIRVNQKGSPFHTEFFVGNMYGISEFFKLYGLFTNQGEIEVHILAKDDTQDVEKEIVKECNLNDIIPD